MYKVHTLNALEFCLNKHDEYYMESLIHGIVEFLSTGWFVFLVVPVGVLIASAIACVVLIFFD